jgi:plasmid stabilization system protein ParE
LLFIERYYAEFGQATADRVIGSILAAARLLEMYPHIGTRGKRPRTRHRMVSGYPYTIVYRIRRIEVQVVRVLHQSKRYFN